METPPRGRALDVIDSLISLIGNLVLSTNVAEPGLGLWIVRANSSAKDKDIFPFIQWISKTWISARCSLKPTSWSYWITSSYNLFP
ncbi:hypothetical protein Tco_0947645 [Tanacetum coccineum]